MKSIKTYLIGSILLTSLSACVSESLDVPGASKEKGTLSLNVNVTETVTRASVNTEEFPITITPKNGTEGETLTYKNKASVPNPLTLSVGKYEIEAHTPGELTKKMYDPYYKGSTTVTINKGARSTANIICKMQNSKVSVKYSNDFSDVFQSWSFTLDDGNGTAIDFENGSISTLYWYFGENGVSSLAYSFKGILKEGGTVTSRSGIAKEDEKNFIGGDDIIITLKPESLDAYQGKITGISINANVFEDEAQDIPISVKVIDEPSEDEPGEEEDPQEDPDEKELPYFECPELETGVRFGENDKELPNTVAKIYTPKGLKSLNVTIRGGNDGFGSACSAIGFDSGFELVGATDFISALNGMGVTVNEPMLGATYYEFPVGAFYNMITGFGPTDEGKAHEFELKLEDNDGNKKSATLRVTIY